MERSPSEVSASVVGEIIRQQQLRLECLKAANETAKLGLSHNVYATAERYVAWVKGEKLADPNEGLDFMQRLDALVQEFLREEKSDGRKILNDIAEYFSALEQRFPQPKPTIEELEKILHSEGNGAVHINPDGSIRHVHKEIQS